MKEVTDNTETLDDGDHVKFISSHDDGTGERVVLFEIDGVEYTIPRKPRANVGLKYLRDLRKVGENVAVSNLLVALLGEDGFDALVDYEDLTMEDLERVTTISQKIVLGELQTSGNP